MTSFNVFLSHNSADKLSVELLARHLREDAGLTPFLDKWHLIPGEPWQEALEEALAQSATVAVFIGPSGISPWHNVEMRAALDRAVRSRDEYRVIPVLLPGASEESVSTFLAQRVWVDFRGGLDDVEAFNRLVAGIKGEAIEGGSYTLPDEPAPYRGLLRFEAEHARFFFGREEDTCRLVEKLSQQSFVAVVGASGSGKSSLVRAGLMPALAQDAIPGSRDWRILTFTPGSDPPRALAEQLATLAPLADRLQIADDLTERLAHRADGLCTAVSTLTAERPQPVLLIVDQFEEIFTLCQESNDRCREQITQFATNLSEAATRGNGSIRVVITLRADFLDRCLEYGELRELLQDRQVLLGTLTESALRDVIVRPAQEVGAFFEKGLVSLILRDVGTEPGRLPLLEHALYELWRARRGPWLTIEAYEASGGVSGALESRAQRTYNERLTVEQQQLARNIFLRLCALGDGTKETRRQARLAELYPDRTDHAQVDAVLEVLSGPEVRLIIMDEGKVEIAHEALIQQWRLLRNWLHEDWQGLQIHRRLTEAAQVWAAKDRGVGYLYKEQYLGDAERWAKGHGEVLSRLEREFLDASLASREREKEQSAVRLRKLVLLFAGLAIVALVFAVLFLTRSRLAETARSDAERQSQVAMARQLAAQAVTSIVQEQDSELSLLLALESVRATVDHGSPVVFEANAALRHALTASPSNIARYQGTVFYAAFNSDGSRMVSSDGSVIRIVDTETRTEIASVHGTGLYRFALNKDGTRLVTDDAGSDVQVWDTTKKSRLALLNHGGNGAGAFFIQDDRLLLTVNNDNLVRIWNTANWEEVATQYHEETVRDVIYNPDRVQIVIAPKDGTIHVFDAMTGNERIIAQRQQPTEAIVSSPDGTRVALLKGGGNVELRDLAGHLLATLRHESESTWKPTFSADGNYLVTAGGSSDVSLWDSSTGDSLSTIHQVGAPIRSVSLSPDGRRLVTIDTEDILRLWNSTDGILLTTMSSKQVAWVWGQFPGIRGVFVQYGTRLIIIGGERGHVLDTTTGAEIAAFDTQHTIDRFVISPDQTHFAIAGQALERRFTDTLSNERSITRLFETSTGKQVTSSISEGRIYQLDFDETGSRLAVARDDHTAQLLDTNSGQELATLAHGGPVYKAVFSPDGNQLATASADSTARLWDIPTGSEPIVLQHTSPVEKVVFGSDGTRIATASSDGTVSLFDCPGKRQIAVFSYEGPIRKIEFGPDGSRLVVAGQDTAAHLIDVITGTEVIAIPHAASASVASIISQSNQLAIGSSDDQAIHLVDAVSGIESARLDTEHAITSLAYSPDGKRLASAGHEGIITIWNVEKNVIIRNLQQELPIYKMVFSPDGSRLASASSAIVHLWNTETGADLALLHGQALPAGDWMGLSADVAFSPDGTRLATSSLDSTAQLVDARGGKSLAILHHEEAYIGPSEGRLVWVYDVEFSSDGRYLATASGDRTARLWDAQTGTQLGLINHDEKVTMVAFSPDGRLMATASGDGTSRVMDTETRQVVAIFRHEGGVNAIAFSPDGSLLAVASNDQTVRLWHVRQDDLMRLACRVLSRNLTEAEWQSYMGNDRVYRTTCAELPKPENTPLPWGQSVSPLPTPTSSTSGFLSPLPVPTR